MHRVAEYGVAAHWAYKEGKTDKVAASETGNKLNWFKEIVELQDESKDAADFMDSVKGDLFGDRVYAFTPKGDVFELAKGSGPLDMAYTIHTEVGNHTTGAKVNGKIVPLDYKIKNGDIVDILTSTNSAGPSRDWINLVSTRRARNKIKQFFRQEDRSENVDKGHEIIEHQLRQTGFDPVEILEPAKLEKVANKLHYTSVNDMYAAIGFGDLAPTGVANRLTDDVRAKQEEDRKRREEKELLEDHQTISNENETEKERKRKVHPAGLLLKGR